uniref:Late endosomal/lysosomal adaptor and MAPK and MTOR activator 5 n=1 Tax=Rhabditophanes sp. KR3021 TaxID=114890 RepID=A0AC35UHW9_9BILA
MASKLESIAEKLFAEEKVKGVVLSDEKGYPMLNKGDCNAGSAGFVAQLAKVASELDKSKLVRVHLESKQDIFIITPNNQMTLGIHKTK